MLIYENGFAAMLFLEQILLKMLLSYFTVFFEYFIETFKQKLKLLYLLK